MAQTLEDIVHRWHASQPHPLEPSITVGDYPIAAKLASVLKFGGESPNPQEVAGFWHEYQTLNQSLVAQKKQPIPPDEFTHLAKQVATSSFTYHGRPPTMYELAKLRDAHPKDVNDYYYHLPDQHYPSVPAGEMVKVLHAARPWARMITNSPPNKLDAAYIYHSGQNPRDYYQQRAQHDGAQDQSGGHPGDAGPGDAGGRPADQRAADPRMAAGNAPAGR